MDQIEWALLFFAIVIGVPVIAVLLSRNNRRRQ